MGTLKDRLRSDMKYWFLREHQYRHRARKWFGHLYSPEAKRAENEKPMLVFMADGRIAQGGIADRLRGILTLFDFCLENGLDFRLFHTHPFDMEDYLIPGEYDWRVSQSELSMNSNDAKAFVLNTPKHGMDDREAGFQHRVFKKMFLGKRYKQIHVYTIFDYAEDRFPELFRKLFRFSPRLQEELNRAAETLGNDYISVSCRFLESLGDFEEPMPMTEPLPEDAQEALIESCLQKIRELHIPGQNVLVTADSMKFLKRAEELDFVKVIPGKVAHLSVAGSERSESDMKTFVDFFTIAKARKSYLLLGGPMYNGNFAKRASQIGGHPYEVIRF